MVTNAVRALPSARWRRLLPVAFITYSFAYLDRSNYSLSAAGGLTKSLHISSAETGLLGGLFFLGYFLFQVPAGDFAERRSVKSLMFWSLCLWGLLAAAQGVIPSYWLLLVDRFLLGVVEAVVMPVMLVFLSHWFSRSERGRADTFLILGNPVTLMWMSVVSGYIIAATGWRWMFIIEGLPAIGWAFAFRVLADDRPADATWLSDTDRNDIEEQLASEQEGLPSPKSRWRALRSPMVIILAAQYLLWSVGVYGFVFWLPTIVKTLTGKGIGEVGTLSAIPYALAVISMVVVSLYSDRSGRRRLAIWPFLLLSAGAFYASYATHSTSVLWSFVLLVVAGAAMYIPYGPYFALIPEYLPAETAGPAIGMINAFGGLGGFAGAYLVGALGGGNESLGAFAFLAACLLASSVLMLAVHRPGLGASEMADPATRGRIPTAGHAG